jgi:hypothetical protein
MCGVPSLKGLGINSYRCPTPEGVGFLMASRGWEWGGAWREVGRVGEEQQVLRLRRQGRLRSG